MKKFRNIFLRSLVFVGLVGVLFLGVSFSTGKQEQPNSHDLVVQTLLPLPEIDNPKAEVVFAEVAAPAGQVCTQRMGCSCKHRKATMFRAADTDQLKKHEGGHDPHLDIKCTRCSSRWYCPVVGKYRTDN